MVSLRFVRYLSSRPKIETLLPPKRIYNRLLFDFDSRLPRKKVIPILEEIYTKLDAPETIRLPPKINGSDLMVQKHILAALRKRTAANKHLVLLENELVEQAAELGDNDAITLLAFEALRGSPQDPDFKTAQGLIKDLTAKKHPLVFKMTGDFAWEKGKYREAVQYWNQFLEVEQDTVLASQVLSSLGIYYFQYEANLPVARKYFDRCIAVGDLDRSTVMAHYYLGQLHTVTDPELARYHFEVAAGTALRETFAPLGFLEMNVFQNYNKAIEWFRLGVEIGDLECSIGEFDCCYLMKDLAGARKVAQKLVQVRESIIKAKNKQLSPEMQQQIKINTNVINTFFSTRKGELQKVLL